MTNYAKTIKYLAIIATLGVALLPVVSAFADTVVSDPETMTCSTLATVGVGCNPAPYVTGSYQPKPVSLNFNIFGSSSSANTSDTSTLTPANARVTDLNGNAINLVQVPGDPNIYALVNGQKHLIPTYAIFVDYGYTMAMVQPITQAQLDKYPQADLLKVKGSNTIYYLTENGMIRAMPNTTVLNSYGDRPEDAIVISQKEMNYYPVNQYVYLANPLNRDVFELTAKGKEYLTPMAVYRLGLTSDQIAPVDQAELDAYKTLAPVVN